VGRAFPGILNQSQAVVGGKGFPLTARDLFGKSSQRALWKSSSRDPRDRSELLENTPLAVSGWAVHPSHYRSRSGEISVLRSGGGGGWGQVRRGHMDTWSARTWNHRIEYSCEVKEIGPAPKWRELSHCNPIRLIRRDTPAIKRRFRSAKQVGSTRSRPIGVPRRSFFFFFHSVTQTVRWLCSLLFNTPVGSASLQRGDCPRTGCCEARRE